MAGVLLRPVWPVARREEGASPAVGLWPTSNEATGQTGRNPKGGSPFRSRLRCSLLTDPLRDMLVARASPGPKNPCRKTPAIGETQHWEKGEGASIGHSKRFSFLTKGGVHFCTLFTNW